MLKQLSIHNLILVDHAAIDFSTGLNVLTGETGSGKSAIIESLNLIRGERASSELIRQGASQASIEAFFEIESIPGIMNLLEEAGIQCEDGTVIIRRELHANGKSRAYINNQMAQLTLLQAITKPLLDSCGQHANQRLLTTEYHRGVVDAYGELQPLVERFQAAYAHEASLRNELEAIKRSEAARLREIEVCRMEIDELSQAALRDNEDQELFAEYSLLSNREELMEGITGISQVLTDDSSVLATLASLQGHFEKLAKIDPQFLEWGQSFKAAVLELQEVAYSLNHYSDRVEYNPQRLAMINDRLTMINKLKRKYGDSIDHIRDYLADKQQKLDLLENSDQKSELLREELAAAVVETDRLASDLSIQRRAAASRLGQTLIASLRKLNMPHAEFEAKVEPVGRSTLGDDRIEFFLAPNKGEGLIPVKNCASGGELARLMLAIRGLLAGKEGISTLVFDEIDANIGGETASIVGQTLSDIGKRHQLICITHFPQVARYAKQHLKIAKSAV
jgi:DNA repair protein RecN (Recombination protein N)